MFWSKQKQAETPVVTVEDRSPKAVKLQPHPKGEVEEYAALCQTILGEVPNAAKTLLLRQFLAERGIPVYNSLQVHDFLMSKIKGEGTKQLTWRPLRKCDRLKTSQMFRWWWGYRSEYGSYCHSTSAVYSELVPPSALETVKVISEQFPDAKFFVSDIAQVKDPFLLVTYPLVDPVVVDFWDEPGFKPL